MGGAVILLEQINRSFGDHLVLSDISLHIQRGEVFGYLGPNGAGKTTTIRILLGLIQPDSGRVEVLRHDMRAHERAVFEQIGVVLEDYGLYERLSAYENLDYYARIYRLPPEGRRARIRLLLEQAELWDRRDDQVGSFSKGMKQKLALARALIHKPTVLFVDEPTSGLDPAAAQAIRELIVDLAHQEGRTVFMTSHNLDEVERMCSRIAILQHGRLRAVGTVSELRSRMSRPRLAIVVRHPAELPSLSARIEALPFVRACELDAHQLLVQLAEEVPPMELWEAVAHCNVAVKEVKKVEMSLEDMYFSIVNEAEGA